MVEVLAQEPQAADPLQRAAQAVPGYMKRRAARQAALLDPALSEAVLHARQAHGPASPLSRSPERAAWPDSAFFARSSEELLRPQGTQHPRSDAFGWAALDPAFDPFDPSFEPLEVLPASFEPLEVLPADPRARARAARPARGPAEDGGARGEGKPPPHAAHGEAGGAHGGARAGRAVHWEGEGQWEPGPTLEPRGADGVERRGALGAEGLLARPAARPPEGGAPPHAASAAAARSGQLAPGYLIRSGPARRGAGAHLDGNGSKGAAGLGNGSKGAAGLYASLELLGGAGLKAVALPDEGWLREEEGGGAGARRAALGRSGSLTLLRSLRGTGGAGRAARRAGEEEEGALSRAGTLQLEPDLAPPERAHLARLARLDAKMGYGPHDGRPGARGVARPRSVSPGRGGAARRRVGAETVGAYSQSLVQAPSPPPPLVLIGHAASLTPY